MRFKSLNFVAEAEIYKYFLCASFLFEAGMTKSPYSREGSELGWRGFAAPELHCPSRHSQPGWESLP